MAAVGTARAYPRSVTQPAPKGSRRYGSPATALAASTAIVLNALNLSSCACMSRAMSASPPRHLGPERPRGDVDGGRAVVDNCDAVEAGRHRADAHTRRGRALAGEVHVATPACASRWATERVTIRAAAAHQLLMDGRVSWTLGLR